MRFMLAPESAKTFIEVELLNSQGKVNRPGSPIFIGNPSIIAAEENSWMLYSNYFRFVITSLANLGSLAMDLRNGALIERDNTCSMNFLCSESNRLLRAQEG